MVVYPFLNVMNECFTFVTFSFIKHVVVWTTIFYIIRLFKKFSSMTGISSCFNILYHSLSFTSITRLVNGAGFSNFTHPQTWLLVLFFAHRDHFLCKAFSFLLVQRLDCLS